MAVVGITFDGEVVRMQGCNAALLRRAKKWAPLGCPLLASGGVTFLRNRRSRCSEIRIEMFLRTYAKWVDNVRDDAEMARLESSMAAPQGTRAGT